VPAEDEEGMVYAPEMIPEDKDKLYCFIEPTRACGPDCMAFMTYAADMKKTELDDNQRHCTLLVGADRVARHVVVLTSLFASAEQKKRTAAQDAQREANTPKAGPFSAPTPKSPFPVEKT
jgi:hypothetical protein